MQNKFSCFFFVKSLNFLHLNRLETVTAWNTCLLCKSIRYYSSSKYSSYYIL